MRQTLSVLRTVLRTPGYQYLAIAASLVVAVLSWWLFTRVTTVGAFVQMTRAGEFGSWSLPYAIVYALTTLLIIVLSGMSVAVVVWLYRRSAVGRGIGTAGNAGGVVSAMLAMGCPVCGAFLLSAMGIAGGLSILPLQGLELKFLSLGLLAGATVYGAKKAPAADACAACVTPARTGVKILPLEKIFVTLLVILLGTNQLLLARAFAATNGSAYSIKGIFGIRTASSLTIIAPRLNPDGKTSSLVEWPTITDVPKNPKTGDALADAKVVMIATGKPFYAPDDIAFDDPINAQKKWGAYENSITLAAEEERRYQILINQQLCSYCCGGPTSVTVINRCGCAHAKAVRGFFKYMLKTYGEKYSNDQLQGEAHRWYAIWYPKGMLEDYLLATGNEAALPHKTHGGAGADGRHGL